MNAYEQKLSARAERLANRASRLKSAADSVYRSGRSAVDGIPFGQPILVGHHSERRHRNAIARYDRAIRKSIELEAAAKRAADAASRVGTGGISADDPDAVIKLIAKLDGLRNSQERMKAANAAIRKHKKAGHEAQVAALVVLGFSERLAAEILKPDFCGRIGFPGYALQNNNANIHRVEERIKQLERVAALRASAAETESQSVEWQIGGDRCRVEKNVEDNRLQLFFSGKPSQPTRDALKSSGWRWAPSVGAWQRHLHTANLDWFQHRLGAKVVGNE